MLHGKILNRGHSFLTLSYFKAIDGNLGFLILADSFANSNGID